MTANEDLDRLRLAAEDAAGGPPSAEQVDTLIDLVDALEARLAALTAPQDGGDALEARQPSGDDREVRERVSKFCNEYRKLKGRDHELIYSLHQGHEREANLRTADLERLVRAAVPDAATEQARADSEWPDGTIIAKLEEAEAKRDAALGALERVQETLSLHNPNGRLVKEVLAALDGAPEPEYEWGAALVADPSEATAHADKETALKNIKGWNESSARIKRMGRHTSGPAMLVRRRKAGPWEPVGGEN